MEIIKVATWQNLADTLKKYVNEDTIGKYMRGNVHMVKQILDRETARAGDGQGHGAGDVDVLRFQASYKRCKLFTCRTILWGTTTCNVYSIRAFL